MKTSPLAEPVLSRRAHRAFHVISDLVRDASHPGGNRFDVNGFTSTQAQKLSTGDALALSRALHASTDFHVRRVAPYALLHVRDDRAKPVFDVLLTPHKHWTPADWDNLHAVTDVLVHKMREPWARKLVVEHVRLKGHSWPMLTSSLALAAEQNVPLPVAVQNALLSTLQPSTLGLSAPHNALKALGYSGDARLIRPLIHFWRANYSRALLANDQSPVAKLFSEFLVTLWGKRKTKGMPSKYHPDWTRVARVYPRLFSIVTMPQVTPFFGPSPSGILAATLAALNPRMDPILKDPARFATWKSRVDALKNVPVESRAHVVNLLSTPRGEKIWSNSRAFNLHVRQSAALAPVSK